MKAICKQAFTAAGKSYKPGDEVEASPTRLRSWDWHGYVELPTTPERVVEAAGGIVGKAKEAGNAALEAVGLKEKSDGKPTTDGDPPKDPTPEP